MKNLFDIINEKLIINKDTGNIIIDIDKECEFTSDEINEIKKFINRLNTKNTPYIITNKYVGRNNKLESDFDLYVYYSPDWNEHRFANEDVPNNNTIYFWREQRANTTKVGYNATVLVKGERNKNENQCYSQVSESPSTNIDDCFDRLEKILAKLNF